MNFKSDAEMIRYYFKELLSDGEEHSRLDIISYVKQRYGETGISGASLTNSMFDSAIKTLLSSNADYYYVRRGVFKWHGETRLESSLTNVCDNIKRVLKTAEASIRGNITTCLLSKNISNDKAFALRDTVMDVIAILEQAEQLLKEFQENKCKESEG